MSKKKFSDYRAAPGVKWENKLPATYETLLTGFNAGMTVSELVDYFKKDKKTIPAELKDVQVGSLSPFIMQHEKFKAFFETEVPSYDLVDHPEVFRALNDDKDIHKVQAQVGYKMDTMHPTWETIVRMNHAQYLGFNLRLSDMTNKNLHVRLEKLRDPEYYQKLLDTPFVKQHDLFNSLPKEPPKFTLANGRFSVKRIGSALEKAYSRSGKPSSVEAYLKSPDDYGVFAVSDMQRTSLKLNHADDVTRDDLERQYNDLRNVMTVAMMSGELGVIPREMTDNVHYPPSARASDQFPVFMMKGKIRHLGPTIYPTGHKKAEPYSLYLSAPVEIQIPFLPDHAIKSTHDMYEASRVLEDGDAKREMEQTRIEFMKTYLPDHLKDERQKYLDDHQIDPKDKIASLFHDNAPEMLSTKATEVLALRVAWEEQMGITMPGEAKVEKLDLNKFDLPAIRKTLGEMIYSEQKQAEDNKVEKIVPMYPAVNRSANQLG